jgi:hypothetical protein
MSKRPSSEQPTTAKRARKASGFRLSRFGVIDPVQSTSSISSRFVTLNENPGVRGTLRGSNRLLHRTSELSLSSESQPNDAEPQVSDATLGPQEAAHEEVTDATLGLVEAAHEEVQLDTSHEHTQGKGKRNRVTTTYVSAVSIFLHV